LVTVYFNIKHLHMKLKKMQQVYTIFIVHNNLLLFKKILTPKESVKQQSLIELAKCIQKDKTNLYKSEYLHL